MIVSSALRVPLDDQAADACCEMRRQAGLTKWQVAESSGLSDTAIGKYESGAAGYKLQSLAYFAHACGFELRLEFVRKVAP